jgi:hypothetical protein
MIGAYITFLSRHEWLLGRRGEEMSSSLLQTIVLNVGLGFAMPMIDNWAHIGGAVGGAITAYYLGPRLYMTDLPSDQGGIRIMVDRPIVRLPSYFEALPDTIDNVWDQTLQQFRILRYKLETGTLFQTQDHPSSQPWKSFPNHHSRRPARRRPLVTPNRSIKPRIVD